MIAGIVILVVLVLLVLRRRRRKARQGRAAGALHDALGRRTVAFEPGIYNRTRRRGWR